MLYIYKCLELTEIQMIGNDCTNHVKPSQNKCLPNSLYMIIPMILEHHTFKVELHSLCFNRFNKKICQVRTKGEQIQSRTTKQFVYSSVYMVQLVHKNKIKGIITTGLNHPGGPV